MFLALIVVAKVARRVCRSPRIAVRAARPLQLAVGLGQIGEFSFVLASALVAAGAIPINVYVAMVAAVAISIGVSAVAVRLVGTAAEAARPPDRPQVADAKRVGLPPGHPTAGIPTNCAADVAPILRYGGGRVRCRTPAVGSCRQACSRHVAVGQTHSS